MKTKLTLSIDHTVIKDAKQYASDNNSSLSKLVENYLRLVSKKKTGRQVTTATPSIVERLRGSIKVPSGMIIDYKQARDEYLTEKYLK